MIISEELIRKIVDEVINESKMPSISGKEVDRRMKKAGYHVARSHGDHVIYAKENCLSISIPTPKKEVNRALMRGIVRRYPELKPIFPEYSSNKD